MPFLYHNIHLGFYEFLHHGHCADGEDGSSTKEETILRCRNNCASRLNVGYFAYSLDRDCSCYFANAGCAVANAPDNYNAYRIIKEGILLLLRHATVL